MTSDKYMLIQSFEEAKVWQKAQELAILVYTIFKNSKDYGFKDQMQRAAVSVSNNIAEGFERQTNKELVRFLYVAKGSSGETRSMNHLGKKLDYITIEQYEQIQNLCLEISKMLAGFIKSCN